MFLDFCSLKGPVYEILRSLAATHSTPPFRSTTFLHFYIYCEFTQKKTIVPSEKGLY